MPILLFQRVKEVASVLAGSQTILGEKLDRRNFRKKLLNLDLIEDTLKEKKFDGNKPAKLYKFK